MHIVDPIRRLKVTEPKIVVEVWEWLRRRGDDGVRVTRAFGGECIQLWIEYHNERLGSPRAFVVTWEFRIWHQIIICITPRERMMTALGA